MHIRLTRPEDSKEVARIYAQARKYMEESGNPNQWTNGYPSEEDVMNDISDGASYVCEDEGEIVATFYFRSGGDATYDKIYQGEWLNDLPYSVIHRIAVKHHGRGIVRFCFEWCYRRSENLKIDTHRDNKPMQRALEKNGFIYCGIIYLESGEERLAYQKCE